MLALYALLAGIAAICNESVARAHGGFHWTMLPIQVVVVFGLAQVIGKSDTFIGGAILFSFTTLMVRLGAAHFYFHEPISRGLWIAVALSAGALAAKGVWK